MKRNFSFRCLSCLELGGILCLAMCVFGCTASKTTEDTGTASVEAGQAQAIAECQRAMISVQQARPEQKAALLAHDCMNVFPEGQCRQTMGALAVMTPDRRAPAIVDSCLRPYCSSLKSHRPRLCRPDSVSPDSPLDLAMMLEFQMALVHERVCPELAKPRPRLCSLSLPPETQSEYQALLLELQQSLKVPLASETVSLFVGLGLLASLTPVRVEVPGPGGKLNEQAKPSLKVSLSIRKQMLWMEITPSRHLGWSLPQKADSTHFGPALSFLKGSPLKPRVAISASQDVPYRAIVALIDALQMAGFDQVVLAPQTPQAK